ncbi:MAG: fused MFS/spermidine synthase [Polyangiaceae bacterium]
MSTAPKRVHLVTYLFFLSGVTALSAEVVLNKLLTYVFGSSHLATSTVLAAYMGGLSVGAWLFGRVAKRARRPVLLYAALELTVGAFYALLPAFFEPFRALSLSLASPLADSPVQLTALRFALSFALVLAPTLPMGGTLPTLIAAFHDDAALEQSLPRLYAVNTLGAAAGALLASYAGVPALGLHGVLFTCGAVNLLVAAASLWIARAPAEQAPSKLAVSEEAEADGEARLAPSKQPISDAEIEAAAEAAGVTVTEASADPAPAWHLSTRTAAALAFAQGVLAFLLEVVWFHLIGTVVGVTVYSFALMLFVILLGIGAGSLFLPAIGRRTKLPPAGLFAASMVLVALGVAASLYGWDRFSVVVGWTSWIGVGPYAYAGREIVRLLFCVALLGPSTFALGLSLPSLSAAVRVDPAAKSEWVGRVFAWNTLGTIAGSLVGGFVLLGRVGSTRILQGIAIVALGLAAAVLLPERRSPRFTATSKVTLSLGAALALTIAFVFPGWSPERLTQGSHYYWMGYSDPGTVVSLEEDAQSGFVSVTRSAETSVKTLKTNGKYEGTDAVREFQDMFALIGALYMKKYDRALQLGLGAGRTLRMLYAMPFSHIDAVEFSPAMLRTARREFPAFSGAAFDDHERVTVACDDGRNFLQLTTARYDYVAVAITGAAFAGTGNIYSKDFFEAIRGRLAPGGVFMLWIQIHHVDPADVRSVVHTLRSVYPNVHLYADEQRGQGFLFASESELTIDTERVQALDRTGTIRDVLAQQGLNSILELASWSLYTSNGEIDRFLATDRIGARPKLLTDWTPDFEYSTPYGLAAQIPAFDFDGLSDRQLATMDPPLDEGTRLGLVAQRHLFAKDDAGALAALRKAREATGEVRFDGEIGRLERKLKSRPD